VSITSSAPLMVAEAGPVQVQGAVNVAGTVQTRSLSSTTDSVSIPGSVTVLQNGPWSTGIDPNNNNVIDAHARASFSATKLITFGSGGTYVAATLDTVPAGRLAIIEHLSGTFFCASDEIYRVYVSTSGSPTLNGAPGQATVDAILTTFASASGGHSFTVSQPMRFAVAPGYSFTIQSERDTALGTCNGFVTVTGHTVSAS
jgi:hypothetical protein